MAKNFRESDYAINKGRQGVVYRLPDNRLLEITFEICLKDDPTLTKEKFDEIKKFSDEDYLITVNAENRENYYSPIALDVNRETEMLASPSVEDMYFEEKDITPTLAEVKLVAKEILPEIQKRRFLMWTKGIKLEEIAEIEGVSIPAVHYTIEKAKKNINNFFEKGLKKR